MWSSTQTAKELEESAMTEAAERNWVEKMAEDGWKVEFFYNGHADGHYWRSRGSEHQYRFEVAIDGFEDLPVADAAENQIEILRILRSYGKEAQDLELVWWEGVKNHVPRAWVRGCHQLKATTSRTTCLLGTTTRANGLLPKLTSRYPRNCSSSMIESTAGPSSKSWATRQR
jgi:hypothetical protein